MTNTKQFLAREKELLEAATEFNHEMKPVEMPIQANSPVQTPIYFISPHIYFNKSDAESDAAFIANVRTSHEKLIQAFEIAMEAVRNSKCEGDSAAHNMSCGKCWATTRIEALLGSGK